MDVTPEQRACAAVDLTLIVRHSALTLAALCEYGPDTLKVLMSLAERGGVDLVDQIRRLYAAEMLMHLTEDADALEELLKAGAAEAVVKLLDLDDPSMLFDALYKLMKAGAAQAVGTLLDHG